MPDSEAIVKAAATALVDRGDPVDLLTVAAELKREGKLDEVGGHAYLANLEAEGRFPYQRRRPILGPPPFGRLRCADCETFTMQVLVKKNGTVLIGCGQCDTVLMEVADVHWEEES